MIVKGYIVIDGTNCGIILSFRNDNIDLVDDLKIINFLNLINSLKYFNQSTYPSYFMSNLLTVIYF